MKIFLQISVLLCQSFNKSALCNKFLKSSLRIKFWIQIHDHVLQSIYNLRLECMTSEKKWARLRAWLCFLVSCSVVLASYVFVSSLSSFFLPSSLGLLSPYLRMWFSTSKPPSLPCPLCPSTSLCSGDSPEQRSAATWQRASPVLSLSGDHQWDLHPCACAKLAGGLPQSHTRHYGVCVASPIHLHLSSLPFSFVCLFHPYCCHVQDAQIYTYCVSFLSIPIAVVSGVKSCSHVSDQSRQRCTNRPGYSC